MTTPDLTSTTAIALIRESIERIAPDVDADSIPGDADVRLEAELDSMDFLAVLSTVAERTGLELPESDVAEFQTIDGFADYLVGRLAGTDPRPQV